MNANFLMVAYDLRGHGKTTGPTTCILSIDNLYSDASKLIKSYQTTDKPIFIVGHSLGGAIAVKLLSRGLVENVFGIIVIDIVEETAISSLRHMPEVLETRPKTFPNTEMAVKWALRSKVCRSRETAEVSFLSQYNESEDGSLSMIVDLMSSQPYWHDWFMGMSEEFVSLPISRLIVLAETDYLDKTLLIGQMQGKFQLEIIRNTGHAIQEDQPKQLSALIAIFIERNMSCLLYTSRCV